MTAFVYTDQHGEQSGVDPRKLSPEQLAEIGHTPRSLIKVIRAKCVECCCGGVAEVKRCTAISCHLWPLRMGKNVFRPPRELTDEQRAAMAERLRKMRDHGDDDDDDGDETE